MTIFHELTLNFQKYQYLPEINDTGVIMADLFNKLL